MLGNDSLVDPVCIHDAFQNFSSRPRQYRTYYVSYRQYDIIPKRNYYRTLKSKSSYRTCSKC